MTSARLTGIGVTAAVVALIALGAACVEGALGYDAPFPGFFVYRSGAVTSLWRADWAGRRAGLRVRDVVVRIDGEAVVGSDGEAVVGSDGGGPALRAALERRHAAGATAVAVEVRRPDGSRARMQLPLLRLTAGDLASTFALPFSIGLVYLLLGASIFRYKRTPEAALACALCLVAAAFYVTLFDAHTTWRFTRVWLLYPLFGPLSVHLFAIFPERKRRWASARVLVPLYAATLLVIAWRQWGVDDPRRSDGGSLVTAFLLSAAFAADLGLLAHGMRRSATPAVRNRAKSIFVGLALTCTTAVAWQFASRWAGPSRLLTADQAMVLSALFPALIAYAILKRNLFDLDAVLRASLIYGGATAAVLGLYLLSVGVAGHWAAHLVGGPSFAVAATLVVAVLFHPLRLGVQRLVDRLLYRESRVPALLALLRALPAVEDVASLAEVALLPLLRLTRARGVLLLVPSALGRLEVAGRAGEGIDGSELQLLLGGAFEAALLSHPEPQAVRDLGDELARERAALAGLGLELVVPLVGKGRLAGLLAFTPLRGGGYGVLHALADAAPQLALALENAALVAERAQRERLAALGQLAAVIVHEVKNPLGIIKVSAGTLRQRVADAHADARTLCECIEDEVDRMDATVRRLLELARPPEPALQPTDVAILIRRTLDRIEPDLRAAGIEVRCELAAAPRVSADAEELERALLNLFLNARQAMPGGGALAVRLRSSPVAELVEIEVEDSGVGMDEATRRQLFRPFFTTRHGGTGLGLAIVKRVIEDHRVAIRVESRPGKGARFTLALPVGT